MRKRIRIDGVLYEAVDVRSTQLNESSSKWRVDSVDENGIQLDSRELGFTVSVWGRERSGKFPYEVTVTVYAGGGGDVCYQTMTSKADPDLGALAEDVAKVVEDDFDITVGKLVKYARDKSLPSWIRDSIRILQVNVKKLMAKHLR